MQPLIELATSKYKASALSTPPRRFSVRIFPESTAFCITVSYNFAQNMSSDHLMGFEITFRKTFAIRYNMQFLNKTNHEGCHNCKKRKTIMREEK